MNKNPEEMKDLFRQLQSMSKSREDLRWGASEIARFTNGALSVELIRRLADAEIIERTREKGTNHQHAVYTPDSLWKAAVAGQMLEMQEYGGSLAKVNKALRVKMHGELGRAFFEKYWGQRIVIAMAQEAGLVEG